MNLTKILTARRRDWLIMLAVVAFTLVTFLGSTLFYSKGEPREAIVALSMLRSGDWVLPVSYGGDIPYKPPFLAWCISIVSMLTGGHVTEFTSRLPSAIAAVAMIMACYSFYRRELGGYLSPAVAVLTSLITLTAFEVHRAATACRVDMVLTACVVGAILSLYSFTAHGRRRSLLWAVAAMSCGVLTKGPVGAILPCLVIGIHRLVGGERLGRVALSMVVIGASSLVVPALWYAAAYSRGGDAFLNLVVEENFGRFLGKMSYVSHANPVSYNFVSIIAGFLPYSLWLLLSLLSFRWKRKPADAEPRPLRRRLADAWVRFRGCHPVTRLSAIAAVAIFVFYCVPESKRSVYLLPVYPFAAYFIARYFRYMLVRGPRMVKAYCAVISSLALLAPLAFGLVRFGALDGVGGKSLRLVVEGIASVDISVIGLAALALSVGAALVSLTSLRRDSARDALARALVSTIMIYWSFSAVYQPAVLNVKSDSRLAAELDRAVGASVTVYTLVDDSMLRFYTVNFYMADRLRRFDAAKPDAGMLIVGDRDAAALLPAYADSYDFTLEWNEEAKSCDIRQPVQVYRFKRKS